MKLITFDPASKGVGYAIFSKEDSVVKLEEVGFISPVKMKDKVPFGNQLSLIKGLNTKEFQDLKARMIKERAAVIIEVSVRRKRVEAPTVHKLALMAGAVADQFGGSVNFLDAGEWTAKIPKEDRIEYLKGFVKDEILHETLSKYPKYQQLDIWDAIGMGLYALMGLNFKKAVANGS